MEKIFTIVCHYEETAGAHILEKRPPRDNISYNVGVSNGECLKDASEKDCRLEGLLVFSSDGCLNSQDGGRDQLSD